MTCARCGKKGSAESLMRSSHTSLRYCLDSPACDRRVKKLKRSGATFDRGWLVAK